MAACDWPGAAVTSRKDSILIGFTVLALAGAGAIFTVTGGTRGSQDADFPEGYPYLCRECGDLTILTDKELFALKAKAREGATLQSSRIKCSACNSENTSPALKCPRCEKYMFQPGRGRPVCTHCREPFPSLFGDEGE